MTVLGCICEPDRATLWVDSETYQGDKAAGETNKFVVNALGVAVAGTGVVGLIHEALTAALSSLTIDDVERQMPGRLRARAAKLAPHCARLNDCWFPAQTFLAIGHSPAAGRMIGWRFDTNTLLEPVLVGRLAIPYDDDLLEDIMRPEAASRVVSIARRQLDILRSGGMMGVTGRTLCVATVTETTTQLVRIPDFDARLHTHAATELQEAQ